MYKIFAHLVCNLCITCSYCIYYAYLLCMVMMLFIRVWRPSWSVWIRYRSSGGERVVVCVQRPCWWESAFRFCEVRLRSGESKRRLKRYCTFISTIFTALFLQYRHILRIVFSRNSERCRTFGHSDANDVRCSRFLPNTLREQWNTWSRHLRDSITRWSMVYKGAKIGKRNSPTLENLLIENK